MTNTTLQTRDNIFLLRPKTFSDFVGQREICENLQIFVTSARIRNEALDHVLLSGPPGLGKTTLAQIIARELGVGFRSTSGPMLMRAGDLAALLANLERRDVLFIDEIHRLPTHVEEVLYLAMEDFQLDLIVGEGPAAHSIRIDLQPFTLVGATTRTGLLARPLHDRFSISARLTYYASTDLEKILQSSAKILGLKITSSCASEVAQRARGTPRIAKRLLRRVRDFAFVSGIQTVDARLADTVLTKLDIDKLGLDSLDRRYLQCIANHYGGGPVGIETIAAILSEQRDTLEEVVEPFLLQSGLLQRTAKGRMLSNNGFQHLGLEAKTINKLDERKEQENK